MIWLNLETKTRTSPRFVGSEPVQRATWLCLMFYCAEHENGGVLEGAALWGDRRWMQTCGVTKDEVMIDCDLWNFAGDNLFLWGYPEEKEDEVRRMREGGRLGGKKSGAIRRKTAQKKAASEGSNEGGLKGGLQTGPSTGRLNGKEGKGRERKGKELNRVRGIHGTRVENSENSSTSGNAMILHRPEDAQKVKLKDYSDFLRADVVSIACTLAGWWPDKSGKSGPAAGFFCKQLKSLALSVGDARATEMAREELFRYSSEVRAGEEPQSPSAAITARFKAMCKKTGSCAA